MDPETASRCSRDIYRRDDIYKGEYLQNAPDLQVGFNDGYRVGWQDTLGAIRRAVVENNNRKWSGDHCATATEISGGVFFSEPQDRARAPHIMDLAPTILKLLGVPAARGPGRQAAAVNATRRETRSLARAAGGAAAAAVAAAADAAPPSPRRRAARARPATTTRAAAASRSAARRSSASSRGCAARRRACSARWSGWSSRCGCAARSCARSSSSLQQHARAAGRDRRAACSELEKHVARGAARARGPRPRPLQAGRALATCACCSRSSGPRTSSAATGFVTPLARRDNERIARFRARPRRPRRHARAASSRRTQEALALRDRAGRRAPQPGRRPAPQDGAADQLVERKETHAAYVEELEQAEGSCGSS